MEQLAKTTSKILHIEGYASLRSVYSQLFEFRSDYEIAVACNGLEGVEKAVTWQPDLILMGLRMPGMDGFQVIRSLRKHPLTAAPPIIVLSAWADAKSKRLALSAGANEHITPPVDIHWLIGRINSHLGRKV